MHQGSESFVKLGKVLRYARDLGDFKTFIAELPIAYRKAMYLIKIAELVETSKLSAMEVAALGWTKLAVITSWDKPMTKTRLKVVVRFAHENTVESLKAFVGSKKSTKIRTKTFRLSAEQSNTLESALAKAGLIPKGDRARFLMKIMDDYVSRHTTHLQLIAA
jgi:hypothetical protein